MITTYCISLLTFRLHWQVATIKLKQLTSNRGVFVFTVMTVTLNSYQQIYQTPIVVLFSTIMFVCFSPELLKKESKTAYIGDEEGEER